MVKINAIDMPPGCFNCNSCGTLDVDMDIKELYVDVVFKGHELKQPKTMNLCKKCRIHLLKVLCEELEE